LIFLKIKSDQIWIQLDCRLFDFELGWDMSGSSQIRSA
jgi:hypothetical protein